MRDEFSRISLIVITFNEEDNIGRCLSSAEGIGEAILVDSFSEDRTVEIAREMGASVFQRPFESWADQKNWAIEKARLEWILILDADEALSPELRAEIAASLDDPDTDGFWLRRSSEFFGRRIRFCGWHRDRVLRLFRRGKGRYPERAVHEKLELNGRAKSLKHFLDHRPYRSMDDYINRMKEYSRRGAEELAGRGRKWFPAILTHPTARFIRMYFLQLGFLDGRAGFLLCKMAAVSVFFKYATLREITSGKGETGKGG